MANVSSSNGLEKYPKLRFKGFSEPWTQVLLSDFFKKSTKKNSDGSITNVICNSAKNGLIPQREYFDKSIANSDNTDGYYIIEQGDFVYNPRKSSDAPYGPVSIYKYPESGIVSPLYLCFRALKPINSSFYDYFFKSPSWHRYIYLSGDSGARHDRVSIKDDVFFSMPVCIPSEEEQLKISSFLSLIEKRIADQQQLVEHLKKYKRGVLNTIFSTKLDSQNSGILLSDICSSISSGKTKITTTNGRYPLFGSTGIVGSTDCAECSGKIVLVARVGANAGLVNYFEGVCGVTDNTLVLKFTDQKLLPKLVYHYLQYYDVNKMVFGSGQPLVTGGQLKSIILPNLGDAQIKKIVKFLDLLDERIAHAVKELHNLTLFKKSIYQNMFI